MPTAPEGEARSPWRAPSEPPVIYRPVEDPVWAEALPSTDPDPTGELPAVSPSLPTPVRLRRGRQRFAVLIAIIVPSVLFVFGVTLIMMGFGLTGDDRPSSNPAPAIPESAPTNGDAPPLATAAVVVEGDPAVVATDLAAVFVSQLRAGQFDTAAALTHGEWSEGQLRAGYGTVAGLQNAVARIAPIGPDIYEVRMVFVQEPTDPAGIAIGRCERWQVSPSGQAVIPGATTPAISEPLIGLLRGQILMTEMARACAAMSIS